MGGALRGLISDLRPALLDQLGLAPALEAMVDRVSGDHHLEVGLEVDLASDQGRHPDRLAPELELAVYRVVQEGLNNVVKHASAERADIRVVEGETALEVSVRDTGGGFDPAAAHGGFGLTGIRERVAQHGGNLEVVSGPGRGTELRITIPARRASEPSRVPPLSVGPAG